MVKAKTMPKWSQMPQEVPYSSKLLWVVITCFKKPPMGLFFQKDSCILLVSYVEWHVRQHHIA